MLHCPSVYEAKYHAIAFAIVETAWILNSMFEFCISYLNPYGEVRATTLVSLIFVPTQSFTHTRSTQLLLTTTLFEIKNSKWCFSNFPCIYFMINLFELIKPLSKKATPLCCGPRLASPMETSILRGHIRKESHPLLLKSLIESNHLHHSINQLSIKPYYFLLSNSFNFGSPYLFLFICSL